MLTPEDKDLLVKKGISEQQIAEQLACFEKGFPFLKLDAAASVEKGIMDSPSDRTGSRRTPASGSPAGSGCPSCRTPRRTGP